MHYFSTLFGKELYMFRTDLLSIIGSQMFLVLAKLHYTVLYNMLLLHTVNNDLLRK